MKERLKRFSNPTFARCQPVRLHPSLARPSQRWRWQAQAGSCTPAPASCPSSRWPARPPPGGSTSPCSGSAAGFRSPTPSDQGSCPPPPTPVSFGPMFRMSGFRTGTDRAPAAFSCLPSPYFQPYQLDTSSIVIWTFLEVSTRGKWTAGNPHDKQ